MLIKQKKNKKLNKLTNAKKTKNKNKLMKLYT